MSKKKTTETTEETGDLAATGDSTEDAEVSQERTPESTDASFGLASPNARTQSALVAQKQGSGLVTWLALLLSVTALGAFALTYLQERDAAGSMSDSDANMATLSASVRANRDTLAALEQKVTVLGTTNASGNAEIDALERQLNSRLRQLEVLPARLSNIAATVSSLQGISTGARDAWLLAEAEYYMQIANAQLQLAGNPELARLALKLADERILQLADPGLTEVRRALSDELRALEIIESLDTEGITLTLASLASVVDSLPLRQEVVGQAADSTALDPDLTGVDRAYASLKNALGGVVSVRRIDETMQPLIAPEAQYFLRANLALQLQAARLAVLRSEEAIFSQSLDDAAAWLNEYYDTSNTAVQNTQQTIAEIRGSVFSVAVPDISHSLRALRQFNALAGATVQPANIVEVETEPEQEEEEEEEEELQQ
jgi:uroporphyrin-3 C-methyltransferase